MLERRVMKASMMTAMMVLAAVAMPLAAMGEVKALPKPVVTGGMPLMDAISQRASSRSYDPQKAVDEQTLGEILWVAWGMKGEGKRTIPTSRNLQNMSVYVLTPQGAWKYDGAEHALVQVTSENLIPLCEKQDFVKDAPVHLVYAAKDDYAGPMHAGSAYQNVYLYATSRGMSTVIRGMIDKEGLAKGLKLPAGEKVYVHQTVGWPK